MNLDLFDDSIIRKVSELTQDLKQCLEESFPTVWVRGEISNLRRQASGHVYFTLKDEKSQISCVLFRGNAMRIAFQPNDGQQVLLFGEISVYEPRGSYQIIVREVQEDGIGRLQREFERLKLNLKEEGLFDQACKRPLPVLPLTIGVVTSVSGAAIRDFISVLRRRDWRGEVRIFPTLVQGSGAAADLVRQIERARKMGGLDLLIVMRGGGSLEDLWPFNQETVVRAIADFPVPTISAVGHEIDFVLTDFAADHRSETPTAAAEWITSCRVEALRGTVELQRRIQICIQHRWVMFEQSMSALVGKIAPRQLLRRMEQELQTLDESAERLCRATFRHKANKLSDLILFYQRLKWQRTDRELLRRQESLLALGNHWDRTCKKIISEKSTSLQFLQRQLRVNGLEHTLQRGFALIRDVKGNPIGNAADLEKGAMIQLVMRDGDRNARVES